MRQLRDEYTNFKRRAAVLVPLISVMDELHILLTLVRSRHLRSHAGEVSFPGGKVDDADPSLTHTALREAHEEIGLHADMVTVIGLLEPALSRSNILVTPVMCIIKDSDFKPVINPDEVESCFTVPIERFLQKEGYQYMDFNWLDDVYRSHKFTWAGYTIFGFTAAVCIRLAKIAYKKEPEFEEMAPGQPPHHIQIKRMEWELQGRSEGRSKRKAVL
ncbi:MAG: hypothetical protein SGCHY_000639 [Lobulomycetales sp.]